MPPDPPSRPAAARPVGVDPPLVKSWLHPCVSVTFRRYLTLYLTVKLASALAQLQDTLRRIGEVSLPCPFTGGFSGIRYRAVNLNLSGKFSVDKTTLFKRL